MAVQPPHSLDAVTALHEVARTLHADAGAPRAANGVELPPLVLVTDSRRLRDPVAAARRLAAGNAVLLRHYGEADRVALAERLADVCRACALLLFVGDDVGLARSIGADGLHLPERSVPTFSRAAWPGIVTAAAHSPAAIAAAGERGADAVLLSPVFTTATHPDVPPLGVAQATRWIADASLPVYALGGIDRQNARTLLGSGAVGLACLGAFAD